MRVFGAGFFFAVRFVPAQVRDDLAIYSQDFVYMARPEGLLGPGPRPFGAAVATQRRSAQPTAACRTPDRLVRS